MSCSHRSTNGAALLACGKPREPRRAPLGTAAARLGKGTGGPAEAPLPWPKRRRN